MSKRIKIFLLHSIIIQRSILLSFLFIVACATKPYPNSQHNNTRIALAPYMHPTNIAELFAGILIPYATAPSQKDRIYLDSILKKALETKTHFQILSVKENPSIKNKDNVLKQWIQIGEKNNLDYIIVPYVLEWKPAKQLQTRYIPNYVIMDYYLISVKTKRLLARSRYFENQVISLDQLRYRRVPNGIFYRTNVTRMALAEDSILMMIEDFNLTNQKILESLE